MIERAQWTEAREHLRRALRHEDDAELVGREVLEGRADCWRLHGGRSYMVTRLEGDELVIVAYEGERCRQVMRAIVEHVRTRGVRSMRFHTQQPWLIELFRDFDPEPLEYVVRVYLHGRQKQKLYQ